MKPSVRSLAHALAVGAASVLGGCAAETPPVLQPIAELAFTADGGEPGEPRHCPVGDEIRPALGCPGRMRLAELELPVPSERKVRVRGPMPPHLTRVAMVLQAEIRGATNEGWQKLPPLYSGRGHRSIDMTLALPEGMETPETLYVRVYGTTLPSPKRGFQTDEMEIPAGAVLTVGMGLHGLGQVIESSGIEFELSASSSARTVVLLKEVVSHADAMAWNDRRVKLDALAGRSVRFHFRSRVLPGKNPRFSSQNFPVWGAPEVLEPGRKDQRRNIILISLDTLRSDHVGTALEGVDLTPNLDRFAAEGVRLVDATTTYPSTSASHMSMLTGIYPAAHGVLDAYALLPNTIPTLASVLSGHGYRTAAVTENAMLSAGAGFFRGFDSYRENRGLTIWDAKGQIDRTFGAGLEWVREHRDERFFLFLHTYQVHGPYTPPPEYAFTEYTGAGGERRELGADVPAAISKRYAYAGEVRQTDVAVRDLLAELEGLGLLDDSIVVITSDHGEEFGEHGEIGHARTVYDEVLRIPWLMRAPGLLPAGEQVTGAASLVDMAPTLLDLVGRPPLAFAHGESLRRRILGEESGDAAVRYAEGPRSGGAAIGSLAIRSRARKWIGRIDGTLDATFDLAQDPDESTPQPVQADDPAAAAAVDRWREMLAAAEKAFPGIEIGAQPEERDREIDAATSEKLKALGYID